MTIEECEIKSSQTTNTEAQLVLHTKKLSIRKVNYFGPSVMLTFIQACRLRHVREDAYPSVSVQLYNGSSGNVAAGFE